ncbi:MAG: PKD domain-containing protein [Methanolinea sp.]|nr:PKD domain-containing protein [Methanolinea sp.]
MRGIDGRKSCIELVLVLAVLSTACAIPVGAGTTAHPFFETTVSVLTPDSDQILPAVFENGIVSIDLRNGQPELVHFNFFTGYEEIINGPFPVCDYYPPSACGDRVIWESPDGTRTSIVLYNVSSGERTVLVNVTHAEGSYPVIRGNMVAFSDYSGMDLDIHVIDLGSGETFVLENGTETTNDLAPDIGRDCIIWQGFDRTRDDSDIYLWRKGSADIVDLTPDTPGILQESPRTDGNLIVWQGYDSHNSTYDVYLHNLTSGVTIILTPGTPFTDEMNPDISEKSIVWQQLNTTTFKNEIVLYSIDTGEIVTVSDENIGDQYSPSIFGERVAWSEQDPLSGKFDIKMATQGILAIPLNPSFDANVTKGSVPLPVQFQDHSMGDPTCWWWDFGDGNHSHEQNPLHVYTCQGTYPVTLIVNTPYQREGLRVENMVVAGSPPVADFKGDPVEGCGPLTVTFTDMSGSSPLEWLWEFGDGTTSTEQNPVYTYVSPGLYNVTLTTGNEFGLGKVEKKGFIAVMKGSTWNITFPSDGIHIKQEGGLQSVTLNATVLGGTLTENGTCYVFSPVPDHQLSLIGIHSLPGLGFDPVAPDALEGDVGYIDAESLEFRDQSHATNWTLSFCLHLDTYPDDGGVILTVWPGATPGDLRKFREAAMRGDFHDPDGIINVYSDVVGVALTARFRCENITGSHPATLLIGIDHAWVEHHGWRRPIQVTSNIEGAKIYVDGELLGYTPMFLPPTLSAGNHTVAIAEDGYPDAVQEISLEDKRDSIRVIRLADEGDGTVLAATFLSNDPITNIDYFRVESPDGLSTLGIVSTSRAGNPLQVLYLTLSKIISSSSGGHGSPGGTSGSYGGSGSLQSSAQVPTPAPTITLQAPDVSRMAPASLSSGLPEKPESVNAPAETPKVEANPPENPLVGLPSAVSLLLIRNLAIIFGIMLVCAILVLRLQRRV